MATSRGGLGTGGCLVMKPKSGERAAAVTSGSAATAQALQSLAVRHRTSRLGSSGHVLIRVLSESTALAFAGCCQIRIVVHPDAKCGDEPFHRRLGYGSRNTFALCCRCLGAHGLFDVSEAQFCYREHLSLESSLFLLAVHFDAGVVLSVLTIAKQVRDVCSLPLLLTFDRFNG